MGHVIRKSHNTFFIIILIFFLSCGYMCMRWHGVKLSTLQLFNDGILSGDMINSLRYILAEIHDKNHRYVSKKMKEMCPALKQVSFLYKPNNTISCILETAVPLLVVNQDFVLTTNKKIVVSDVYHPSILYDIPRIHVMHFNEEMADIFVNQFFFFFSALLQETYDNFTIYIRDECYITLTDKQDPTWTLIASAKNNIHEKTLKYYFYIKELHRHIQKKKYIDMRFSGMMIFGYQDVGD